MLQRTDDARYQRTRDVVDVRSDGLVRPVRQQKIGLVDDEEPRQKVVRTALQDASSVAGLLVMTEAMVAEKPEKKAPPMPPGGGMGGDMDF